MYLRHTTRHKDGKTHVYWQLVRSVRRGAKIVQDAVGLARSICGQASGFCQGELFEPANIGQAVAVKLDAIGLERSRSFGAVWLGWLL